jgi:murein DD-endopeptidase MepM/ murein hydrolase activator NlpD
VARGELIGYMGDSGNATAPCLHFEVRLNGKRIDPLDGYLDKKDIVTPD